MPQTKVQVVAAAVNLLGQKSPQSLINQSDLVNTASEWYDRLYSAEFETGTWRFATTIVRLNRLVDVPVGGYWQYTYQLPANYRKLIHLWPMMYDYEIYAGRKLYTDYNDDVTPLYLEHQYEPDVGTVPDSFWNYFATYMAERLSISNAQTVQYAGYLKDERISLHAIALAADSQNRPNTPLQSAPILTRRYVSTFVNG